MRRSPTPGSTARPSTPAPPSAPIAAADGTLVIDRSTDPPTFQIRGETRWPGTSTCTHPDGSVETHTGTVGDSWAWFVQGSFDGVRFIGRCDARRFEQA